MENKTTNISGQTPEQERKFAELQERVDKLESICFASKEVLNLEVTTSAFGTFCIIRLWDACCIRCLILPLI